MTFLSASANLKVQQHTTVGVCVALPTKQLILGEKLKGTGNHNTESFRKSIKLAVPI